LNEDIDLDADSIPVIAESNNANHHYSDKNVLRENQISESESSHFFPSND
jgi:hypothetical protein